MNSELTNFLDLAFENYTAGDLHQELLVARDVYSKLVGTWSLDYTALENWANNFHLWYLLEYPHPKLQELL